MQKELDKYGLKPGLSRNKAKKLLRYIYDQLHPFEDEFKSERINEQQDIRKAVKAAENSCDKKQPNYTEKENDSNSDSR